VEGQEGYALHFIDILIVAIYMVGVLSLGVFFARYVKTAGDFFIAGKALPFWAIGMSVVVSDIGATDFMATAGAGYTYGVAAANFDWMGSMPAMAFAAFIFIPYYWRAGVYTIPEFLGRRYNAAVQVIHGAIWGVFLIVMLGVMLYLTAGMLVTVVGGNLTVWIWVIAALTGVYTCFGGLSAVVMTDAVQLVVMFIGGFALFLLSMFYVGGWGSLQEQVESRNPEMIVFYNFPTTAQAEGFDGVPVLESALAGTELDIVAIEAAPGGVEPFRRGYRIEFGSLLPPSETRDAAGHTRNATIAYIEAEEAMPPEATGVSSEIRAFADFFRLLLPHDSSTPYPWTGIVFGLGIVLATGYMAGNQAVVQRTLGARSEWDAKGGMLFAGFLKVFIPIMIIIPGLAAVVLVPGLAKGDMAVPTMMSILLPPGLKGLMFAALFAALMSSVDSTLNSATTIWTTDLYGRAHGWITGARLNEHLALIIGRVLTIVFIILGAWLAPWVSQQDTMYDFIQGALSMFQGPVLAILLVGIMWRRATQWGGLVGLLTGVGFTTMLNNTTNVFPSENPFLFIAWWSFVFTVVVTILVSLVTPQDPDEKVRGLIFGQVMQDGKVQRVLQMRTKGEE